MGSGSGLELVCCFGIRGGRVGSGKGRGDLDGGGGPGSSSSVDC